MVASTSCFPLFFFSLFFLLFARAMAFPRVTAAAKVITVLLAIVAVDYVLQEYKVREVRAVVRQTRALAEQVTYIDNQQHQLEVEIARSKETIASFEKQKTSLKLVAEHVQRMQAMAQEVAANETSSRNSKPARRSPVSRRICAGDN